MPLLAFDTATPATVVALRTLDGAVTRARHDPAPGDRPGHAAQLLPLAHELLTAAGLAFADLDRVGVGVGPGTFTGLRIGVSTARALAAATGAALVPVPTLAALADGAPVLAVLDARRGEAFVLAPGAPAAVIGPEGFQALVGRAGAGVRAVGDGAVRFRAELEAAGAEVPPDDAAVHLVDGAALVRLAAAGAPVPPARVVPAYLRLPDAELALQTGTGRDR